MTNTVDLFHEYTMRDFVELDGGKWWTTEGVLNDPVLYRRLVRTQIEELLALSAVSTARVRRGWTRSLPAAKDP